MLTPSSWTMLTQDHQIAIRPAKAEDASTVRELSELDSARPLPGDVLLAEVDGHAVAAVSLDTGQAVADPFVPSAPAVGLLQVRARQLRSA